MLSGFLGGPLCEAWSRARFVVTQRGRVRGRPQGRVHQTGNSLGPSEKVNYWCDFDLGLDGHCFFYGRSRAPCKARRQLPDDLKALHCQSSGSHAAQGFVFNEKPTDLVIHKWGTNEHLLKSRILKEERIGRDNNGEWRAAIRKAYCPSDFCRALALLEKKKSRLNPRCFESLPSWFQELYSHTGTHGTGFDGYSYGRLWDQVTTHKHWMKPGRML